MAKTVYTAEATVTGGRGNGHGRTSDGMLDLQLRYPREMGGDGGGTNPEQLFAVGYAACFEGALGRVSRLERIELGDVSIDSHISLVAADLGYNVAPARRHAPADRGSGAGEADRGARARGVSLLAGHAEKHRGRADGQRAAGALASCFGGHRSPLRR